MRVSKYPKGSEWRKWDLHIHTPSSICQNYGGDTKEVWDKFIEELERLPEDVKVIGINDYYFIDGYERLMKEYRAKGRLKNIEKIFPILEFRIDTFGTASESKFQKINFHILFDLDERNLHEEIEKLKTEFIQQIQLTKLEKHKTKPLSRNNFINESPEKNLQKGFDELIPNTERVLELVNSSTWKQKVFLLLGYIEWNNLEKGRQLKEFKQDLYDRVDAFFTASKDDNTTNKDKILSLFGKKKLFHSLDIHGFEAFQDYKCFTWIKADPTFVGIKQTSYEPDRVYVGEQPIRKVDLSNVIKGIEIKNSNGWFNENCHYEFNEDQVSIIGGKGTGKTALLDLVAYACGSLDAHDQRCFINRAWTELQNAEIVVHWLEGEPSLRTITKKIEASLPLEKQRVLYLNQSFVESLISHDKIQELTEQIEKVIFQNIEKERRTGYLTFNELKESELAVIHARKKRLSEKIISANKVYIDKKEKLSYVPNLKENLRVAHANLLKYQSDLAELKGKQSEEQANNIHQIETLRTEKAEREKNIFDISKKIKLKDELSNDINTFIEDSQASVDAIKQKLLRLNVAKDKEAALSKTLDSFIELLKESKIEDELIKIEAQLSDNQNILYGELNTIKADILTIEEKSKLEESQAKKFNELSRLVSNTEESVKSLIDEINTIDEYAEHIEILKIERESNYVELFNQLYTERAKLIELYSPLIKKLEIEGEENTKLFEFNVKFEVDTDEMANTANSFINHSKAGRYFSKKKEAIFEDLQIQSALLTLDYPHPSVSSDEFARLNKSKILDFIHSVESLFRTSDRSSHEIKDQLRDKVNESEFYDWLYSFDWFSMRYSIKFNSTELEKLSPGLKGLALLILFLELDKDDRRPLLIDQPEENLDNRSIYETLRTYFLRAKERRQIFLVTHNPNLVVNTDSEQVFVANFSKERSHQPCNIYHVSGSLEHTMKEDLQEPIKLHQKGIRQHICHVLEGGEEAFKSRERKYSIA